VGIGHVDRAVDEGVDARLGVVGIDEGGETGIGEGRERGGEEAWGQGGTPAQLPAVAVPGHAQEGPLLLEGKLVIIKREPGLSEAGKAQGDVEGHAPVVVVAHLEFGPVGKDEGHGVGRFGAFDPEVDRRGRDVEPPGGDDLEELEGEHVLIDPRVVAVDRHRFAGGVASRVEGGPREPGEAEPWDRTDMGLQGREAAGGGRQQEVAGVVAPGAALVMEAHLQLVVQPASAELGGVEEAHAPLVEERAVARPLLVDQRVVVDRFVVRLVREEGDARPRVGEVDLPEAGIGAMEEVGGQFLEGGAHGGVERDMAAQVAREVGFGGKGQGGYPVLSPTLADRDFCAETHEGIALPGGAAEDLHGGGLLAQVTEVEGDHLPFTRREAREGLQLFEEGDDLPLPERACLRQEGEFP